MTDNIKIEISEIKDNKGEVLIKNEEWISYYNQFYEMSFAQISGGIRMHGFRKGNIPSILLEIKYPYLVEEANQRSMLAVMQAVYMELLKQYKNAKIDNYRVDEKTKNFILSFSLRDEKEEQNKDTNTKVTEANINNKEEVVENSVKTEKKASIKKQEAPTDNTENTKIKAAKTKKELSPENELKTKEEKPKNQEKKEQPKSEKSKEQPKEEKKSAATKTKKEEEVKKVTEKKTKKEK